MNIRFLDNIDLSNDVIHISFKFVHVKLLSISCNKCKILNFRDKLNMKLSCSLKRLFIKLRF